MLSAHIESVVSFTILSKKIYGFGSIGSAYLLLYNHINTFKPYYQSQFIPFIRKYKLIQVTGEKRIES